MSASIHHLKITLRDVNPKVVRELLVPSDLRLDRLHEVFQVAMGWEFAHLHEFIVGSLRDGERFGPAQQDSPWDMGPPVRNERRYTLKSLAPAKGNRFIYWYDFGDDWYHDVLVRSVAVSDSALGGPVCLAAQNACPPEDCGGPWGYANLLEAVRDPEHPEHADTLDWLGDGFDPTYCDRRAIQREFDEMGAVWASAPRKRVSAKRSP